MKKPLAACIILCVILCSGSTFAKKSTVPEESTRLETTPYVVGTPRPSIQLPSQTIVMSEGYRPEPPDLIITQVIPGTPSFEEDGSVANVPLTINIRNVGGSTNEQFRTCVHVHVDGENGYHSRPFTVSGQSDDRCAPQNGLGSGAEATLTGNLQIGIIPGDSLTLRARDSLIGKGALIKPMVDTTSESMPEGRVVESNEENNEMEVRTRLS